jgi:hypothetical protein
MATSISVSARYLSFSQVRYKRYFGMTNFAGHKQTLFSVIGMTVMVDWRLLNQGSCGRARDTSAFECYLGLSRLCHDGKSKRRV